MILVVLWVQWDIEMSLRIIEIFSSVAAISSPIEKRWTWRGSGLLALFGKASESNGSLSRKTGEKENLIMKNKIQILIFRI
jgi:hypothetical protein